MRRALHPTLFPPLAWGSALALALGLAACSAPGRAASTAAPPSAASQATASRARSSAAATPARPSPLHPASVAVTQSRTADGSTVTVARFTGPVRFRLHSGSQDPGAAALAVVRAGPRIRPAERRHLLAAFNGGFLLSAGAGGYEQEGHMISPLRPGLASLIINRSGTAHIGVWGAGWPAPHEAVASVRQNLAPLVSDGQPSPAAAGWAAWGVTLGGGEYVARSALGETATGQLVYAASMSTTPADLAAALVRAGVRTGMELDINPEWVQLDAAPHSGGPLRAVIPGQVRPPGQYLTGWTRDFITVLGS
jgi:hypothetical protein